MSYSATVYKVMIASPSDVQAERELFKDVINEWNAVNSTDKKIVLMPVSWETHASPAFGRPQGVINQQILKDADLLVAAFWTRLGTPTGKATSGTIEEINEHINAGKQAMLYFSTVPINPQELNTRQYKSLEKFIKDIQHKSLYESYKNLVELKDKFSRQLSQTVMRHFTVEAAINKTEPPLEPEALIDAHIALPALSETAKLLLVETSKDTEGSFMSVHTRSGFSVSVNNQEFTANSDARDEARWRDAIQNRSQQRSHW